MPAPYDIKIAPAAKRHMATLPGKTQKDLVKMIEALGVNPRPPGAKKIEGLTGLYVNPINGLRLVYKIEEQAIFLLLVK